MAESTLSLAFEDLGRSTAFYLGWGRKATAAEGLTAAQAANVLAANNAGMRNFLNAFDWSFKRPRATFTLWSTVTGTAAAGLTTTVTATTAKFYPSMVGHTITFLSGNSYTITAYTSSTVITVSSTAVADSSTTFTITATGVYRLPDNFGSMAATELKFEPDNGDTRVITMTNDGLVTTAWQESTGPSRPTMGGIRPLTTTGATGQRFDLVVSPIPDQTYTITFTYEIHPDALTAGLYPYGGLKYAELIRQFCLASAESMFRENQMAMRNERDRALQVAIADELRNQRADRLGRSYPRNHNRNGRYANLEELVTGGTVGGVDYN